jgi:transcriptional regulator with XRE-family HTH domain
MPINRRITGSHYDIAAFATRLRNTREAACGMTRSEFARRVGVTPNSVWGWETQFARPRPEMLSKIASVLQVSETFLKTGSEPNGTDASETYAPQTVPVILADTRQKVASATGMPPSRVRVSVEFLSS